MILSHNNKTKILFQVNPLNKSTQEVNRNSKMEGQVLTQILQAPQHLKIEYPTMFQGKFQFSFPGIIFIQM